MWVIQEPHLTDSAELDFGAIAVDARDNVYIGGMLYGTFNANPLGKREKEVSAEDGGILLWKLSATGQYVDAGTQPLASAVSAYVPHVVVDDAGSAYVCASYFSRKLNHNHQVIQLSRFDRRGQLAWSDLIPEHSWPSALAIDDDGNAGVVYDSQEFVIRVRRFSARGRFLSDTALAVIPRRPQWGYEAPTVASLAFDHDRNMLLCGTFDHAPLADFDAGPDALLLQPRSTRAHYEETYLAKYTPDGRPIFAEALNAEGDVGAAGAGIDRVGHIHVAGDFGGRADFNPDPARVFMMDAGDIASRDPFEATYDEDGKFISATTTHTVRLDERAVYFGLAPSISSPRAVVLALIFGDDLGRAYSEAGISVFAS